MFKKLILIALLFVSTSYGIENSIAPMIEQNETLEQLIKTKYAPKQFAEIETALARKADKIRLISFNMLFDLYDHNLPEDYRWPARKDRIIEVVRNLNPDLIGTQELYLSQLNSILETLGDTYEFIAKPEEDGELNGIFYRKDRFELIKQEMFALTSKSDILTMAQLKDLQTGEVFAYFNMHMSFSKIDKREQQALMVQAILDEKNQEMPVLFSGDLNTFPNLPGNTKFPFYDGDYVLKLLCQGLMQDARTMALLGHLGPLSTFTNDPDDVFPFQGTGTPGVFLDHILVSPEVTVLIHAVEPATVGDKFPSDHMPIAIDFLLGN